MAELTDLKGVGPALAETLAKAGLCSPAQIAASTVEQLVAVPGIGEARARMLIAAAGEMTQEEAAPQRTPKVRPAKLSEKSKKKKPKPKSKKAKKSKDKKKKSKGSGEKSKAKKSKKADVKKSSKKKGKKKKKAGKKK